MSGHTPGPWEVGPQNGHGGISICEPTATHRIATVYLATIQSGVPWGRAHFDLPENAQAFANARLIAAAPELLEALEEQVAECFDEACEMCARHERIIAKAKGGAA